VVPGAVRALPEHEANLRAQYATEFAENETMCDWADENRPRKRTKQEAIASGNRVLTGASNKKDEAYHDVDVHTQSLWYHNKIKHTLYDLAHQLANVIKHIFGTIHDKDTSSKVPTIHMAFRSTRGIVPRVSV
jgi:hypothetical protein